MEGSLEFSISNHLLLSMSMLVILDQIEFTVFLKIVLMNKTCLLSMCPGIDTSESCKCDSWA